MRVWGKADSRDVRARGVARAFLANASRQELASEAACTLLAGGNAERVGAWIEARQETDADEAGTRSFRGVVMDADGGATPEEWSRLSPAPPLPRELLVATKSVHQELPASSPRPVIGALVGLRQALWVPVETLGHLRGVILAGSQKTHASLPQALAENVAAQLMLALHMDDERRVSHQRQHDLAALRGALALQADVPSPAGVLRGIVEDCTARGEDRLGPDTVFAAIGQCEKPEEQTPVAAPAVPAENERPGSYGETRFLWASGDSAWIRALSSEPLSTVWRQALESQRVIGSQPAGVWSHREVTRLVAFPLRGGAEILGVLVAGIRRGSASLNILERLELRATLAASALVQQKRIDHAIRLQTQPQAVPDASTVAARLQAGAALTAAVPEERARIELLNVIEWLEEGVVLSGANNEIRAMNTRFGQLVGLTPEESVEIKTMDALVARLAQCSADAGSFSERWQQWAKSGEAAGREELQLARPVPRVLERTGRSILDDQGVLLGRVEIYRDMTAQRVFHSKLLQTEKLAALGQMVTGIAHELSNPLTTILGYAQRLLLRSEGASHAPEARQIFDEAERASAILRQLLMSARESRPERRRVSLNQVVSHAVELQRFSLAADKVHVHLDLDTMLPFVYGDSGQLQQVLMNLIGNARQAMEEQGRGGTIQVRTLRIAEKSVLVEVQDDGPGIPAAIQARIFDPFFTTKPAGVGTGLGLAIVQGIVREHGGRVRVTSPPGGGTTFSVELPAVAMTQAPEALPATKRVAAMNAERLSTRVPIDTARAGAVLLSWAGLQVLVVEDEPTVARLIGDVLEDEGLRVDVLLDGREALQRVQEKSYDLVICDMKMPELDGEHFYETLARSDHPVLGRFLFVTGDVLAARTRDFLERNRLPHLAKPFRVEELTETIRNVLAEILPRPAVPRSNAARP